jgi:hypothetical protein
MRAVLLSVFLTAFTFSAVYDAHATRVSPKSAANICKGKTASKDGGCSWCGKVTCTTVTCGDTKDCDVIVVQTEREAKPNGKVPDAGAVMNTPSKAAPQ